MKRLALQFTGPYQTSIHEETLSAPAPHEVLVQTLVSAISPGTELLLYRGQWPENIPVDETIPALARKFAFPLKYGYAAVGRVVSVGSDLNSGWLGKTVFSFNPHESHFTANPEHLIQVPETLTPEEAAFLPNMETSVSFLMDGRPMIGERVVVFGQGVVGLLTTSLLARCPLSIVVTFDKYPLRRIKSRALGANATLDPMDPKTKDSLAELLGTSIPEGGADLAYELSGNPSALDQAILATGFGGRIVVGSWYGGKRADIDFGGRFHRSRIHIVSSQVSRLSPELTGRWNKSRRILLALRMLEDTGPAHLITHRIPIQRAAEAYAILDQSPDTAVQVILTYEEN